MRIGIIDADLLSRHRHRFPNLACMKISGYYKKQGEQARLLLDYKEIENYDKVFVSKVFTDTYVPEEVLRSNHIVYGGTGFYYDKAPPLPENVEHSMPDYDLYHEYIQNRIQLGENSRPYRFYTDYSIGFLTRGCFRRCDFCVNKNSKKSVLASPLGEFLDIRRKKLCFLDDNFLACKDWEKILDEVMETGKRFQFRQGLDIRIMQKRQMEKIFAGKLDERIFFAFDDIRDRDIIIRKLEQLRETVSLGRKMIMYVLCGFDRKGLWKEEFWVQDIRDTLERVRILMCYGCLAYIMRYEKCWQSPYRGMYITISRWCNQPAQYTKKSLREFCISQGEQSASYHYLEEFEKLHPELAEYFDMKYEREISNGVVYRGGD